MTWLTVAGAAESGVLSSISRCLQGPCHDAAVVGTLLVAVGDGALTTFDIAVPQSPHRLGSLAGLGAVRQVVLADGIAYVAAREDGLIVVDVREPAAPRVLARYDTLEKATGIAVAANLCFVACRYFGVEIIDVGDPAHPRHLATAFPTLEAQSVTWSAGRLYAGIWADRLVVVADVSDPRSPRELGRIELDGYGDGVTVRDGVLYAATGHHARAFAGGHWERARQAEPGWGAGHGLEMWDVRDPAQPRLLARHKTRPFYVGIPDMWSVEVHGGTAFLTDTMNGVEAVDVSDPASPRTIARVALPDGDAAGGLAVGPDVLYVAGLASGLHVVPLPGTACNDPVSVIPATAIAADPRPPVERADGWWVVRPGGQVREVARIGPCRFALAAGDAGVHLLDTAPSPVLYARLNTHGPARSVAAYGDLLVVAEGWGGLSTWRLGGSGAELLGRWSGDGEAVIQVVVPPPGRWAVIERGIRTLAVLDLADPAHPVEVAGWTGPGIFYGPQIAATPVAGRWLAWWWHTGGPYWLDLDAPGHPAPVRPIEGNLHSGVTGADVAGDHLLVMARDGLVALPPEETRDMAVLPVARLGDNAFGHRTMNGQATVAGDLLLASNAAWSMLRVVDVADPRSPRLLRVVRTPGNPGRALVADDLVVLPDGCEGVRIAPLATLRTEP
jgi:hypothetical protein